MTPREIIMSALRFQPHGGPAPHLELEFHLTREMFGEDALNARTYFSIPEHARRDALARNAKLWIRVAEDCGWNGITGFHDLPVEAQIESFQLTREMSGERFLLTTGVSGTQGIPSSDEIGPLITKVAGDPEGLMEDLDTLCRRATEDIRALTEGGAELVFMVTDYAFNNGPFLSPTMFARFVSPFAKRLAAAIHAGGAFAVQHSDGNLWMILDEMLSWNLDGLHALDPRAGMDIRQVREKVGDRWCLFGNVDSTTLRNGAPEEVRESARYCLEHGPLDGSGYVFTSSNCIFSGTPPENYRAMLLARDAGTPVARATSPSEGLAASPRHGS